MTTKQPKMVCARYVNFPGSQDWDLGNTENPTHQTITVEAIMDADDAQDWFDEEGDNVATFPLRLLSPALQARARRAVARRYYY